MTKLKSIKEGRLDPHPGGVWPVFKFVAGQFSIYGDMAKQAYESCKVLDNTVNFNNSEITKSFLGNTGISCYTDNKISLDALLSPHKIGAFKFDVLLEENKMVAGTENHMLALTLGRYYLLVQEYNGTKSFKGCSHMYCKSQQNENLKEKEYVIFPLQNWFCCL